MKILKTQLLLILLVLYAPKVMAQEITMFSGFWAPEYYQDDKKINKKELEALFIKNDEVQLQWKKAKTQETVAGIATLAELGLLVWAYSEILDDRRPKNERAERALGPLVGSLGSLVIGVIYLTKANRSKKNAILTYNRQFDKQTSFYITPVGNQNGLGLALKF
ncbi:hypothetical protein [Maribacter sp. 2307UL18-2]|uniref:hypothetical protein n=1 Tax=Maribacter sp. 2307UL18-2 TaxID=3386274 RepID=UPI0039BD2804